MTKPRARPNVPAATSARFAPNGPRRLTLLVLALATAIGSAGQALAYFGRAGEVAAEEAEGPGTFEAPLLDALARLASEPDRLDGGLRLRRFACD